MQTYICLNVPTLYLCSHCHTHLGMWMYRSCTQMYMHQNYCPTVHTSHLWQHSHRHLSIIDTNLHTSYLCLNRHTYLHAWMDLGYKYAHTITRTNIRTHTIHHTYARSAICTYICGWVLDTNLHTPYLCLHYHTHTCVVDATHALTPTHTTIRSSTWMDSEHKHIHMVFMPTEIYRLYQYRFRKK